MERQSHEREPLNCVVNPRRHRVRYKKKVVIGCGAGFAGDRPAAALKLLQMVEKLDYVVLDCVSECTLAERCRDVISEDTGYDPRISEWMELLLALALERDVCIISNMGAKCPHGAQEEVLRIASKLELNIKIGLAYQSSVSEKDVDNQLKLVDGDVSVYLGAAPIVECLNVYRPNVLITSLVANASLFLAPMVFELGWNWTENHLLAQGAMAGHLLGGGCQLTGGYHMLPDEKLQDISIKDLLDTPLPFAEVMYDGTVIIGKAEGSGGVLNSRTCAEQLLNGVGDPSSYITPDVIVDFRYVVFNPISGSSCKILCHGAIPSTGILPEKLLLLKSKDMGWKGWGEISYGGFGIIQRAKAAEFLVRGWMEESYPGSSINIASYIIGLDSLKATCAANVSPKPCDDTRLRMDGLFKKEEHAIQFTKEFMALYSNGPAGGGGIRTGIKKEIFLDEELVGREYVHWRISATQNYKISLTDELKHPNSPSKSVGETESNSSSTLYYYPSDESSDGDELICVGCEPIQFTAAPAGRMIPLYDVARSRSGGKGNDLTFSLIPHYPPDIKRLKKIVTPEWVKKVLTPLLDTTSFPDAKIIKKRNEWIDKHVEVHIYKVGGIDSLNVVVSNILDGGVNCSRRIDRHGKTISDIVLCQLVVLPP